MEKDIQDIAAVQVKDLMSKEVIKVYEDDTFDDVANIMIKKSVNRVPVVDKDNKIKGIICRYDIIKSMYE
jgi:CBS domain-containing protein